MAFNKQKFVIALVCGLLGWGVGYEMGKNKAEKEFLERQKHLGAPNIFHLPFSDLFEEEQNEKSSPSFFERFFGGKKPESQSEQEDSIFNNPFAILGGSSVQPKISTREDDDNVYMDIDLESFDKNSLSARVEGETVVIEGNQKSEEGGSSMSSHFYQSFPVPGGTDAAKVDMSHENNKLILKFPKIK